MVRRLVGAGGDGDRQRLGQVAVAGDGDARSDAGGEPVYSWIVSRLPRRTFIPWTYGFMAINLVVFFALFRANAGHGGIAWGMCSMCGSACST